MPEESYKNVGISEDWRIFLEVFYQSEIMGDDPLEVFEEIVKRKKLKQSLTRSLKEIIIKLKNSIPDIDNMIKEHVINWDKERILKIDLVLLRIGIGLFMFGKENPRRVISNVLDISRAYSGEDSYKFLNGVLDKVAKRLGKL